MVTPELHFDQDGFLDLSVFPDTEPDVYGHGPAVLDPLLAEDRRELDATVDDTWFAAAVTDLVPEVGDDERDERLAALLPGPVEPTAGTAPNLDAAVDGDDPADDDGEDIEIASLLHGFTTREGSTGEGPTS